MPDNSGKLDDRQLELLLRDLAVLRTLPSSAAALLETSRLPAQDSSVMSEIVRFDPALAAKYLAEAAALGQATLSVPKALDVLGVTAVRCVALTIQAYPPAELHASMDLVDFWRHSIAVAMVTEALVSAAAFPLAPQDASVCGLLHDVGKLVLAQVFPKSYARSMENAADGSRSLTAAERAVLGVDHALAGRHLALAWRLPATLVNVIWLHHQAPAALPAALEDRKLIMAVKLADAMARREDLGAWDSSCPQNELEELAGHLGLRANDLRQICQQVASPLKERLKGLDLKWDEAWKGYRQANAEAGLELVLMNQELRKHAAVAASQARALARLRELTSTLDPQADADETLLQIAKSYASARGSSPTPRQPAVAYSLDEGGQVQLLAWGGAGEPRRRLARRAPAGETITSPGPAVAALARLLEEPGDLADWFDAAAYTHRPLLCGNRQVGGVLLPASACAAGDEEIASILASAMALALALVEGRASALRLGEQLASASQALAETQEALTEARTISAIGEMASGAAHELNNPLAIVSGRAQLMRNRAANEEDRKIWSLIAEQSQRISDIITELMEFASPPRPAIRPAAAGEILAAAAKEFSESSHPKSASIRVDIQTGEGLPYVQCDGAQIRLALGELLSNAATASPAGTRIVLAAEADETGRRVVFRVSDRGAGMGPATLANAFMPFFSAQQAGRRRGMGLPRAKRYVENNRGRIWIRSKLGEGTTVFLELPAATDAAGEGVKA